MESKYCLSKSCILDDLMTGLSPLSSSDSVNWFYISSYALDDMNLKFIMSSFMITENLLCDALNDLYAV